MFWYIIAACVLIYWLTKRPSNIPPGPRGIPLLGYLPFLDNIQYETFHKLSQKYGKIFSLYLGNHLVVVINEFKTLQQAYLKQGIEFDGRPEHQLYKDGEETNFFYSEFAMWLDYRRYGTTSLRDFGLGKTSLEPLIEDELRELVKTLKSFNDKKIDIRIYLGMAVHNIMSIIIFGHRFNYDDDKFVKFCIAAQSYFKTFLLVNYKLLNPFSLQRLAERLGIISLKQDSHLFIDIVDEFIDNDLKNNNATNFIKIWIEDYEKGNIKRKHLSRTYLTLFIASVYVGNETVVTVLYWNILHMMKYTNIQDKLQDEIDKAVESDRFPLLNDKSKLSYVEATLHECDRYVTLLPYLLNHMTTKSTKLCGYNIPKGTIIMSNLWSINNDQARFPNPQEFDPLRHFNKEGKVIKPAELVPFSLGRRSCPGEMVARMQLFLFMSTLFQQFSFKVPDGDIVDMTYTMRLAKNLHSYQVVIKSRF